MLRFGIIFGFYFVFAAAFNIERFDEPRIFNGTDKVLTYDLLTMTQMWPQTACWDLNGKWTNNNRSCCPCELPESKQDWTLHGLWPSNRKGAHPSYCKNTKFNIKLLSNALIAQLEEKWPTMKLKVENEEFWRHEWDKHGTCALNLPNTNSLPKYFSKSVQMLDEFNVGKILATADIYPGKKYDLEDVLDAITSTLGVKVNVNCAIHQTSKEHYLNEIETCFNTSFELIDCPKSKKKCKKQVWYPEKQEVCE